MAPDTYQLGTERLGPMPVINHFLARMGLADSLERFVPYDDARLRLAPAAVLGVVVRNLVTHREPSTRWASGAMWPEDRAMWRSDVISGRCSSSLRAT